MPKTRAISRGDSSSRACKQQHFPILFSEHSESLQHNRCCRFRRAGDDSAVDVSSERSRLARRLRRTSPAVNRRVSAVRLRTARGAPPHPAVPPLSAARRQEKSPQSGRPHPRRLGSDAGHMRAGHPHSPRRVPPAAPRRPDASAPRSCPLIAASSVHGQLIENVGGAVPWWPKVASGWPPGPNRCAKSPPPGSNRKPPLYKSGALPVELGGQAAEYRGHGASPAARSMHGSACSAPMRAKCSARRSASPTARATTCAGSTTRARSRHGWRRGPTCPAWPRPRAGSCSATRA